MKSQTLHVITWKEKKIFVAKFLELELASQGKTKNEAIKNLKEALELYLDGDKRIVFPTIEEVATHSFSL